MQGGTRFPGRVRAHSDAEARRSEVSELNASFLRSVHEQLIDETRKTPPPRGFISQSSNACFCDAVIFRFSICLCPLPRAFDPASLLEPDQSRIQRSLIQHLLMLAHLFEARGNRVCV